MSATRTEHREKSLSPAIEQAIAAYANRAPLWLKLVRGIFAETGRLTCTGEVIHFGRRIQTAEARIVDAGGKLYAHGSGTFMVYTE